MQKEVPKTITSENLPQNLLHRNVQKRITKNTFSWQRGCLQGTS